MVTTGGPACDLVLRANRGINVSIMPVTNKRGRPTKYSKRFADRICSELAEGKSLRTVCSSDAMPNKETVFRWLRTKKDFSDQYARAKEEATDALADEILDISDEGVNDWMEKRFGKDEESSWVINGEALQRSKLRVDTRKWLMAKMKPKKYGDKLDVTSDGKVLPTPITTLPIKEPQ